MRHSEEHESAQTVEQVAIPFRGKLGIDQSLWPLELICQFKERETHLLHYYPSKTMGYKNNWSFLPIISPCCVQSLKEHFGYVGNIRIAPGKGHVRVIAERHDSGSWKLNREEVLQPKTPVFGRPRMAPVSLKSMDRDNTRDVRYLLEDVG